MGWYHLFGTWYRPWTMFDFVRLGWTAEKQKGLEEFEALLLLHLSIHLEKFS